MAKKETTMSMVMKVVAYSMTEYQNTVIDLFGTSGAEQMGPTPSIPQIIGLKNELHEMFKNITEMGIVEAIDVPFLEETIHRKYGWLGTSYMEVSLICNEDGHHIDTFTFPSWGDVMRIFVRNILAIGTISPKLDWVALRWVEYDVNEKLNSAIESIRKKRILTRIRSNVNKWYAYDGLYKYTISTRTSKYTNDPTSIKMIDILKIRDIISFTNPKFSNWLYFGGDPDYYRDESARCRRRMQETLIKRFSGITSCI